MNVLRRRVVLRSLVGLIGATFVGAAPGLGSQLPARPDDPAKAAVRELFASGISFDDEDSMRVMGLGWREAGEAYLSVTKKLALPAWYEPSGLVYAKSADIPATKDGARIRRVVVDDARAMIADAASDGIGLWIVSGYRSYSDQTATFAYWTAQRGGDELVANQFSARPGHSQHQLGTAIDFNSLDESFADTAPGRWLRANAHRHGFAFPYTHQAVALTGYVYEPWHVRWVGRELAALMMQVGYLDSTRLTADDLVALVRDVARLPGLDA